MNLIGLNRDEVSAIKIAIIGKAIVLFNFFKNSKYTMWIMFRKYVIVGQVFF